MPRSKGSKKKPEGDEAAPTEQAESSRADAEAMRRAKTKLTEEEYEFIAKDIMSKPPNSGYLKYHLPLRFAARCEEVRWVWTDENTGRLAYKELIGGGRNSDLEYD